MTSQKLKSVLIKAGLGIVIALALVEIATRLSGISDVPVYAVDDEIGYIVKPNQSGRFLDRNSWAFNSRSMPTADEWNPSLKPNVLLIGNSIVMGGNPYDQKQKLAPLISADTHGVYEIWPLAAGGWTNVNEMVYLRRNPDVVKAANFFVWEYMSGGLSGVSRWRGDYVFPSARPILASWYAFGRYVAPRFVQRDMNELPPVGDLRADHQKEFEAAVTALSQATHSSKPGIIFAYPTKKELAIFKEKGEWLPESAALSEICKANGLTLVDVAKSADWNESLYRDGVHPTVQGNVVLAKILSDAILQNFVSAPN